MLAVVLSETKHIIQRSVLLYLQAFQFYYMIPNMISHLLTRPSTDYLPLQKGQRCYFKTAWLSVYHFNIPTLHIPCGNNEDP